MVTTIKETERKYEGSPIDARLLGDVTGIVTVGEPAHHTLEAMYYDTADLRLARAHITLRRREGGTDEGWHAKLPSGVADSRNELHVPLSHSGGGDEAVPDELAGLVLAYTGGAPLRPCARIRTERTSWQLLGQGGSVLAEVVDDEVHGQALGDSVTADQWHELEVELVTGGPELLDRIGKKLGTLGIKRSARVSKLARALAGRLPDETHSPVSRKSDAGTAVTGYLRATLAQWRAADVLVRRDESGGVHDLRVALRRVRSTFSTFKKVLRRNETRALSDEIKWLAELLGQARDIEVVHGGLDRAVHDTPLELVLGPVPAELTRHFAARQAGAQQALLTALRGERYLALLTAMDALVAAPPLTGRAAASARLVLPRLVRRSHRRTVAAVDRAYRVGPGPDRDEALHEARKAAKRARYACEAVEPVFGQQAKRLRKAMKNVQGTLGDQHDTVAARTALRELAVAAHGAGNNAFTYGLLYGHAESAAEEHQRRFTEIWPRVVNRKATRWLRG